MVALSYVKTTHASSEVVGLHLDVAVGALMSSTLSVLKATRSGLSETCHKMSQQAERQAQRLCVGL